jgi:alkylation response protein AidB-like acyl-CoA dehydrogenase
VRPYPAPQLGPDLSMTDLTPDDLALRALVRSVVSDVVAPEAARVDRDHAWPARSLAALAEIDVLGLLVPEEYGGVGATVLQYVLTIEEIARGCAATAAIVMTQAHAALPILHAGSEELKARWLPELATGREIGALALTEAAAGSDLGALTTRLRPLGDSLRLTGAKTFITNGGKAGVFCVLARETDAPGNRGLSMVVVPGGSAGLRRGAGLRKMGLHGSETVELWFDGVEIAESDRLGAAGQGWEVVRRTLTGARLSTAAQAMGIAQAAYGKALAYARQREQFGRPVFEHQGVQFRLADMAMQIESARALLHRVARAADSGVAGAAGSAATWSAMAKVVCSDTAMRVATDAVQTLGGYGYMEEYEVERLMRDAKITQIYDGTNDINRLVAARGL